LPSFTVNDNDKNEIHRHESAQVINNKTFVLAVAATTASNSIEIRRTLKSSQMRTWKIFWPIKPRKCSLEWKTRIVQALDVFIQRCRVPSTNESRKDSSEMNRLLIWLKFEFDLMLRSIAVEQNERKESLENWIQILVVLSTFCWSPTMIFHQIIFSVSVLLTSLFPSTSWLQPTTDKTMRTLSRLSNAIWYFSILHCNFVIDTRARTSFVRASSIP
jgi:hypothetical protein